MTDGQWEHLRVLQRKLEAHSEREVINIALTLLSMVVDQRMEGDVICALNKETKTCVEFLNEHGLPFP